MESYVYEYSVPVTFPAEQAETFKAISDASALKSWFAEHAEVEAKNGGDYRFWGKYTLGAPSKHDATQVVTKFDPPTTLSFSWRLLDRDSEVTWTLTPEKRGTKVKIRHEFSSLPEGVRMKEMIDDLWRLNTGNLCFYVMGKRDIFRPDFDDPSPEVRHQIVIDAPREKVFAALTTPEHVKKWFGAPAPFIDRRVGGEYGFGFSFEKDGEKIEPPPMTILEYVENQKFTITWPDWRGDTAVPDQRVAWTLEDAGAGKTRLTLVHSGFIRAVDVSDYPFGWFEFMDAIGKVAEAV